MTPTLSRPVCRSLYVLSVLLAIRATAGFAQSTVRPDSSSVPPTFKNDTITQSLTLERRWLQVHAERDAEGRPTGHYAVFGLWPDSNFIAAYTDYAYGEPSVALVADGIPAVVVLSSYTGGLGSNRISNYTFKVLVVDSNTTNVPAFTLDPGDETFWSSSVVEFSRLPQGGFTFRIQGGPVVRYERRILTWRLSPSR